MLRQRRAQHRRQASAPGGSRHTGRPDTKVQQKLAGRALTDQPTLQNIGRSPLFSDLPPALSFFGTICGMNPILLVLIIGAVIYLLVVLYKIIKPEFSNAKAKPNRPLNGVERKELEDYFQGPKDARKNIWKYSAA